MAYVRAHTSVDFTNGSVYYDYVEEANSSRIAISDGYARTIYHGQFYYDYYGDVHGTLWGAEAQLQGRTVLTVGNFAMDTHFAQSVINSGDATQLYEAVLKGNDFI